MDKPQIKTLQGTDDFHDSSLLDLIIDPNLSEVSVIISTPDEFGIEHIWQIDFLGVLRIEYESVGNGKEENNAPIEIYSIYEDLESSEYKRWKQRAKEIGIYPEVHHIVLASSFIRGWGEKEYLEGVNLVCREWKVRRAPAKYRGKGYSRPKIESN